MLIFIWSKILFFDRSCQADLVKDKGLTYFTSFLEGSDSSSHLRTTCFFILALVCDSYPLGQQQCATAKLAVRDLMKYIFSRQSFCFVLLLLFLN